MVYIDYVNIAAESVHVVETTPEAFMFGVKK